MRTRKTAKAKRKKMSSDRDEGTQAQTPYTTKSNAIVSQRYLRPEFSENEDFKTVTDRPYRRQNQRQPITFDEETQSEHFTGKVQAPQTPTGTSDTH